MANALARHPLCRGVEFEIMRMPPTRRSNWTVSLKSVRSEALFEAHEIVADDVHRVHAVISAGEMMGEPTHPAAQIDDSV